MTKILEIKIQQAISGTIAATYKLMEPLLASSILWATASNSLLRQIFSLAKILALFLKKR